MKNKVDIDRMFIGELRTHTGPIKIILGRNSVLEFTEDGEERIIPHPDKQFMYELSLAYQCLLRRKENYLNKLTNHE